MQLQSLHALFIYLKKPRIVALISAFVLLTITFSFYQSYANLPHLSSYIPKLTPSTLPPSPPTNISSFWPQFYGALLAATPRCALPHHHIEAFISLFQPYNGPGNRQSLIELDEADVTELATAHKWFVSEIQSPTFPLPPFKPGTAGVVTSAGGEFLPEALVAIKMLRRTGSQLPVDVFIADEDEVEPNICETVLKDLGATCHVLSRILDAEGLPRRQNVTRYQLKAFALLFSEYDNLVWIDADQFPVVDPLTLFEAEPFKSKGLVTWPDYWYSTTSPLFYQIAGIPEDKIPSPGLRASSETGQLLISKSIHWRTLELVAYYNFHGPTHYYKLLSQGAVGEGDKETFLAAAHALGAPFYAVGTPIDTIGFHNNGLFKPTGMLQASPIDDLRRSRPGGGGDEKVRPAFLHSEQHKPNAGRFSRLWQREIKQRMWEDEERMVEIFGSDMEKAMWEDIVWTACGEELKGYQFRDWVNNPDWVDEGDICAQARAVYDELFAERTT